jgi:zinc/manganese transport system substrate-binding protein
VSGSIAREQGRRLPLEISGWFAVLCLLVATIGCATSGVSPTPDGSVGMLPGGSPTVDSAAPSPTAADSAAIPAATATSRPAATQPPTPARVTTPEPPGAPIRVVAIESFYGDLARQIGGDRVTVITILSDPNLDPHEYESTADDAKAIANAQVLVKNSLGYDAFVDKLTLASPRPLRKVIGVGELVGHVDGDNPHLWYDPTVMPKVAQRLAAVFTQLHPADSDYFQERLDAFTAQEKNVDDLVAAIRTRYQGTKVLPTEPVFDYMAVALGLDVVDRDGAFQKAVEEGNDPPAAAVAAFRAQLASHTIKVLIYNNQAVTPITKQMQALAAENNVAIVAVSETEPANTAYQQWMIDELTQLQTALGG